MRKINMSIEIVLLNQDAPDPPEGGKWILIEEDCSGSWYGTGFGTNMDGSEVIYISLPDSDFDYDSSTKAALEWGESHGVSVIYVRRL
jgi:hypothetical protein